MDKEQEIILKRQYFLKRVLDDLSKGTAYGIIGWDIDNLDNPLFGKISGATIKNVNLRNVVIKPELYKDYGALVCSAYNYKYFEDKIHNFVNLKIQENLLHIQMIFPFLY